MHLAIEALGVRHGGGVTVVKDLLAAAIEDRRFSRISVFCSPRKSRTFDFPLTDKIVPVERRLADTNRLYRWWWLEQELGPDVKRLHADVLITMCGAGISAPSTPHVTFIQQSLPFSPEAIRLLALPDRLRLKALHGAMRRSSRAGSAVIVQTRTMKETVAKAFHLDPHKIVVATPSVNAFPPDAPPSPALDSMRAARPGYRLLYVGSEARYKNVTTLIEAARTLRESIPALALFLTWPTDHPAAAQPGITRLGYLDGTALRQAYQLADILIMPSLQETVGLPVAEAMSAGTPVIAADRPYAREVCGDAALFFDPSDSSALCLHIDTLLKDENLRSALIARGLELSGTRGAAQPYRIMLDTAVAAVEQATPGSRK